MTEDTKSSGISRRALLAGAAATAASSLAASAGAIPVADVKSWDISTDVLVEYQADV